MDTIVGENKPYYHLLIQSITLKKSFGSYREFFEFLSITNRWDKGRIRGTPETHICTSQTTKGIQKMPSLANRAFLNSLEALLEALFPVLELGS